MSAGGDVGAERHDQDAVDRRIDTIMIVNGARVRRAIEPRQHLIDFLREELGLTGSHTGCEHGVCGACSLRVDGRIVRGCLMLAVQAGGRRVETIEGLADSGELKDLQTAFHQRNALQCGFCTPGMLVTALDIVRNHPGATREDIREHLSANYCRCTGYQAIVDAVESVLRQRASA
jgi:carbon-monoxide dehydrogenase small subunit